MAGLIEKPDAIMIHITDKDVKRNGGSLRTFIKRARIRSNSDSGFCWYLAQKPKHEVAWVYVCIGGVVRFRLNLASVETPTWFTGRFKAELVMTNPMVMAEEEIPAKGFRGFKYTKQLF